MSTHGHTEEEVAIQQRLLSEMAFIGTLMIAFMVISYNVMGGGQTGNDEVPASAGVSESGVFDCEEPGGRDAMGSDAPRMESAGFEDTENPLTRPGCDLSSGRLALLGDGPLHIDAPAPSANRFEEEP